jgi:hypothetical protein
MTEDTTTDPNNRPAVVAPLERQVRRYPLDVEGGQTDEGAYCMSKGHHDKAAFLEEARIWWGDEMENWTEPEHKWLRVVPDPSEEWRRGLLMDAKPHSRGAFPATWTERRSA